MRSKKPALEYSFRAFRERLRRLATTTRMRRTLLSAALCPFRMAAHPNVRINLRSLSERRICEEFLKNTFERRIGRRLSFQAVERSQQCRDKQSSGA
jgi:hypothetical protein